MFHIQCARSRLPQHTHTEGFAASLQGRMASARARNRKLVDEISPSWKRDRGWREGASWERWSKFDYIIVRFTVNSGSFRINGSLICLQPDWLREACHGHHVKLTFKGQRCVFEIVRECISNSHFVLLRLSVAENDGETLTQHSITPQCCTGVGVSQRCT